MRSGFFLRTRSFLGNLDGIKLIDPEQIDRQRFSRQGDAIDVGPDWVEMLEDHRVHAVKGLQEDAWAYCKVMGGLACFLASLVAKPLKHAHVGPPPSYDQVDCFYLQVGTHLIRVLLSFNVLEAGYCVSFDALGTK